MGCGLSMQYACCGRRVAEEGVGGAYRLCLQPHAVRPFSTTTVPGTQAAAGVQIGVDYPAPMKSAWKGEGLSGPLRQSGQQHKCMHCALPPAAQRSLG